MGVKSTSYKHSGNRCAKTTRYSDGCAKKTVSNRKTGSTISVTKYKTPRHQNW